jgi:hypothetical protein
MAPREPGCECTLDIALLVVDGFVSAKQVIRVVIVGVPALSVSKAHPVMKQRGPLWG